MATLPPLVSTAPLFAGLPHDGLEPAEDAVFDVGRRVVAAGHAGIETRRQQLRHDAEGRGRRIHPREKARARVAHRMRQHRARDFVEQNVSRRGLDRQRAIDPAATIVVRDRRAHRVGTNAREALSEQIDSAVAEPPELLCGDLECAHDVAARRCSVPDASPETSIAR